MARTVPLNEGVTTMIRLKRVLVATDFSEFGDLALKYGCEFAQGFSAELHLIHAVEPPTAAYSEFGLGYIGLEEVEATLVKESRVRLDRLPEVDQAARLTVVREVLLGTPFREIIKYARDHEIDLIVVGTHGRGAIAHMLMGSTAERIVRHAPCPVLTVRPGEHEFVMP